MFKVTILAVASLMLVATPAIAQRGAPVSQGVTSSDLAAQLAQSRQQNAGLQIEIGILTDDLRQLRGRVETQDFQGIQRAEQLEDMQADDAELAKQISDLRRQLERQGDEISALRAALGGDVDALESLDVEDTFAEDTRSETSRAAPVTRTGPTRIVSRSAEASRADAPAQTAAREPTPQAPAGNNPDVSGSSVAGGSLGTISASKLPGQAGPLFAEAKTKLIRFDYAGAEEAFRSFIDTFGDDPQAGEAHYWLGESLYQQDAYADSGAAYTTMIRSYPNDPRAPDALVKLARSMRLIGDKEKACLALNTLPKRYPTASDVTMELAAVERTRSGCGLE